MVDAPGSKEKVTNLKNVYSHKRKKNKAANEIGLQKNPVMVSGISQDTFFLSLSFIKPDASMAINLISTLPEGVGMDYPIFLDGPNSGRV